MQRFPSVELAGKATGAMLLAVLLLGCAQWKPPGQAWANAGTGAPGSQAGCRWNAVRIPGETLVDLEVAKGLGDVTGSLTFATDEAVAVMPLGGPEDVSKLEAGREIELQEPKGRLALQKGPVQIAHGLAHFVIPDSSSVADLVRLDARPGTRLKLERPLQKTDGKFLLPAGTAGVPVVLAEDHPQHAKLAGDALLEPSTPPSGSTAWLDAGILPITSRGRSLEVRLHDPERRAADFAGGAFQACISSGNAMHLAGVDLVGAAEGVATLAVWMPWEIGSFGRMSD